MIVCKLFVWDRNTWYLTVYKNNSYTKKGKYTGKYTMNLIP